MVDEIQGFSAKDKGSGDRLMKGKNLDICKNYRKKEHRQDFRLTAEVRPIPGDQKQGGKEGDPYMNQCRPKVGASFRGEMPIFRSDEGGDRNKSQGHGNQALNEVDRKPNPFTHTMSR